jgi:hypothetical protein
LWLKSEQWKFKLNYWFLICLTHLQLGILNSTDKPLELDAEQADNMLDRFSDMRRFCDIVGVWAAGCTALGGFFFWGIVALLGFSVLVVVRLSVEFGVCRCLEREKCDAMRSLNYWEEQGHSCMRYITMEFLDS